MLAWFRTSGGNPLPPPPTKRLLSVRRVPGPALGEPTVEVERSGGPWAPRTLSDGERAGGFPSYPPTWENAAGHPLLTKDSVIPCGGALRCHYHPLSVGGGAAVILFGGFVCIYVKLATWKFRNRELLGEKKSVICWVPLFLTEIQSMISFHIFPYCVTSYPLLSFFLSNPHSLGNKDQRWSLFRVSQVVLCGGVTRCPLL